MLDGVVRRWLNDQRAALTAAVTEYSGERRMRLSGKVGLVTAAASGMGRAGVLRFAREGAAVAVVDRDEEGAKVVAAQINATGGKAIAIAADLRDVEIARSIVQRTVTAFGGLDFVWNHVGHPGPATLEDLDMEDFSLAVDLNLRSALATTGAAVPHMRKRGGGALLFTSSVSGLVASPISPVYAACKFGVVGLARSLAKRLAKDRIRCNVLCPGIIETPMLNQFFGRQGMASAKDPMAAAQAVASSVPLGRLGRPDEVANAALFLLSDEASYISGVALPIDGALQA
jgi:NAD(P)-dependent dehydrogenase (short-subunit alcohol dehydrogenase family)